MSESEYSLHFPVRYTYVMSKGGTIRMKANPFRFNQFESRESYIPDYVCIINFKEPRSTYGVE